MANAFCQHVAETQKPSTLFGYPAQCVVTKFQTNEGEYHIIHVTTAAITDPATDLANAPNGSILVSTKLWHKTGLLGAKDGTWTAQT